MKLQVGERLEGAGPAHQPGGYVVTSVVRETPWHGLYAGKKIFYNFDFTAKRVRETDDVEWLDVLLRTNRYPVLDDPSYVQARRALARAEVRVILGNRHSNLWPEPLDLLEIENTRDAFEFADEPSRGTEPVVVYTKPQGRFTAEWQQQILPVSSILSVLAELLEFVRLAHTEGLLLLGLGPASLLIDSSDRVHYVGTEMVLSQQNALLKETTASAVWQRLFSPERFVRGYSAPECFDPNKRPDVRSDLYAWGSLAFSLLTGMDLGKMSREQGRPWATLGDAHWQQLESVLAQMPRNSWQVWAEQVGVDAYLLLEGWPKKFVTVFRSLLNADRSRRPGSAVELLAWLADPPPPPVADVIALHTDADTAKLLLDCTGIEPGLEMTIQCARSTAPRSPQEGATVADGPLRPVVGVTNLPLTMDPIYYTVFTRRREDGRVIHSPGVAAQLWKPSEQKLRQWVEEQAAGGGDAQQVPTRVGMVLGELDARTTADSLLASPVPRVRAWCLHRIEKTIRSQGKLNSSEALLWRFLKEPSAELRQSAAATLWSFHPRKTDELLLRIVEALETPPIDAPIPLMQFLRQLQVPEDRTRTILQQLETKRPTECPLCQKPLTLGERANHLQAEHGYVVYQGDVLPVEAVIARLWQRVLEKQDHDAHEMLTQMYLSLPAVRQKQDVAIHAYLADLQRYLLREDPTVTMPYIPVALSYEAVMAFQACLRPSAWFAPVTRRLLESANRRLHDLGTQAAIPYLQDQIRGKPAVDDLRLALRTLCNDISQIDQQIELCRQLSQAGADQALVHECIAQLQEERLVSCTECKAHVRTRDIELHLRRAHQIFQFRGVRGGYPETREAILKAICTPPVDVAAWKSLQSLASDKHPQDFDRYLVVWMYQFIKDADGDERSAALTAFTEVLIAAGLVDRMMPHFVGPGKNASWELLGQRIALEVCARLPQPGPARIVPQVLAFLDNKDIPRRSRENAVLALLRAVGKDEPRADEVLRAYVAHSSKKRSVEKLEALEQRFGHSPVIDALRREIGDEIRMSCPRCPTELRRKDMVGHLWDRHRLVLDGERVREPWRVLEDWVVDYGLEKDPQLLRRCRELALRDDPETGLVRLQRLLYRRGLRDRELLNELRASIKSRKATLCPHCCATVVVPNPPAVPSLALAETSLDGNGYHLEVSEHGLIPTLHVETPDAILYHDREPGRLLTRLGALVFIVAPVVAFSFLMFYGLTRQDYPILLPVFMALGAGMLAVGMVFALWPSPQPAQERLLRAAWKLIVPEMLEETMRARDWAFLHGLVEISEDMPHHQLGQDVLLECCEEASEAGATDEVALTCLASLSRRCIADMRDGGEDSFGFVLTLASECFQGRLPLRFLSELLHNFHGADRSTWTKYDLHRLPIMVAQRAFSADVDIDDWLNLGRAFPVLHAVLNLESRWHWLQFQSLWLQRNRRPWDRVGQALMMIDLVKTAGEYEDLLTYYPDVLLYVPKANLVLGSKGVWIEGVCVTAFPANGEVSAMRIGGGEWDITVGTMHIRTIENPLDFVDDIRRWLRWYFHEFVPTVMTAAMPLAESRHRMWQLSKVVCPDCQRGLVPCPGDLGVALK